MKVFKRETLWLIAIYVAIVCAISLRCSVEATNYVSFDSILYLKLAENISAGKGIVAPQTYPFDETVTESYFAIWPVGYPLLIVFLGKITGLNFLIASKVVNLLFLGFIFILLYLWFKKEAWFIALYFFSFSEMEVFSYTWSEGPFLFFVLFLCYLLTHLDTKYLVFKLVFCLISMFLLRYAGGIYFLFVGLYAIYHVYKGRKSKANILFLCIGIALLPCLWYLWNNYIQSGYFTGLVRFTPEEVSNWFTIKTSLVGVANEFLFASHYFVLKNNVTWVFCLFLTLQIIFYYVLWSKRSMIIKPFFSPEAILMMSMSFLYLFAAGVLQRLHACSYFDYRILAPFSLPLFLTLFWSISKGKQEVFFVSTKKWVVGYMVLCYIVNLPKYYLINLLF